jgi:preprotein translocase subunit SecG
MDSIRERLIKTQKNMFGFDQISWASFLKLTAFVLIIWYLGLMILAWLKSRFTDRKTQFEDQSEDDFQRQEFQPIRVSAKDFATELIPPLSLSEILPGVSFQEEMGMDEGYALDAFLNSEESILTLILNQIQYQQ